MWLKAIGVGVGIVLLNYGWLIFVRIKIKGKIA